MSHLPKQLYWAIDNKEGRSVNAFNWRKVCALAQTLSVPVSLFDAFDFPKILESLLLPKKKMVELHELREQSIRQELDQLITRFNNKKVEANYQLISERPFYKAVINQVRAQQQGWMVTQSSETGIPNIVWQLIRHSPIPIYIAKEKQWQTPINILVAIDPVHEDESKVPVDQKILATAIDISHQYQANLHVVHCYSPIVLTLDPSIQKKLQQLHREHFREAIKPFHIDSNRAHLLPGDPSDIIKTLCQSLDIDLLIMGAVSHNSLGHIFVGNTAEEVIPAVDADILLVNP